MQEGGGGGGIKKFKKKKRKKMGKKTRKGNKKGEGGGGGVAELRNFQKDELKRDSDRQRVKERKAESFIIFCLGRQHNLFDNDHNFQVKGPLKQTFLSNGTSTSPNVKHIFMQEKVA